MRDSGLRTRATHLALPALAGGFALALLVTADAGADTVMVADERESRLAAHLDLTGARYVIDLDGFSARLTVRDLKLRTSTVGFRLTVPGSPRTFTVATTRTKAGEQTYLVERISGDGKAKRTCRQFAATWDDTLDRIDVHIPWSCLGDLHATMRVQGSLGAGGRLHGDPDDRLKIVKVRYR